MGNGAIAFLREIGADASGPAALSPPHSFAPPAASIPARSAPIRTPPGRPVATAYAVWVGIGSLGIAIAGIVALGECASPSSA
ncbi:MAG: SMR family transporter [Dongiaceae bacterium]